jgi:hypothetical protein
MLTARVSFGMKAMRRVRALRASFVAFVPPCFNQLRQDRTRQLDPDPAVVGETSGSESLV